MYMKDYISHLDAILSSTGEKLLGNAGSISHQQAMDKAQEEYRKFQSKTLTEVEKSYLETIKKMEKNALDNK
ncbi:MAG: RhuM family protein [Tissierellaceae bacterium]